MLRQGLLRCTLLRWRTQPRSEAVRARMTVIVRMAERGKSGRILIDIDLTLSESGDEQVHRKVKSAPAACAQYEPQTDTLLLYLGLIHRVPLSVLTYNTCFLRNFRAKSYGISPPNDATTDGTSAHRYFIPPKLSVQLHEADDIMLIRGPLTWEEDFNLPIEDDSDGEVVFVEDAPRVNDHPPARILHNHWPPPQPLPPKIDLAAELRKKQIHKKRKNHVSTANSPKPTVQDPSTNYVLAASSSSLTGLHAENHQRNRN